MTRSAAPTVLCAGMAVLDQVFRVERMPATNAKVQASAFASVIGGCAANAAVAIARLGGRAVLAAAFGAPPDDAVGDVILAALGREGVIARGIIRVAGATSTISSILVDAAGDRMIATRCDERLFAAMPHDPRGLTADVDIVLADNWLPDLVTPICAAARARGIPVVIDGDGPMAETGELVRLATHIVFAADALRATTGIADLDQALVRISRHGTRFLAVTDGANDILWLSGGSVCRMPVVPVEVVDTLAAGDVFNGAFALSLAEGCSEAEALRCAAAAAAIKCTRRAGGAGAPCRSEVESLLASRDQARAAPVGRA